MQVTDLKNQLNNCAELAGQIFYDKVTAPLTSMKTGGSANIFLTPNTKSSLYTILKIFESANTPFLLLGGATNVVLLSSKITTPIISLRALSGGFVHSENYDATITLLAGTSISHITKLCIESSLSGFEEFAGLPGTIGGAVSMNARCFGKEISDVLQSVDYLNTNLIQPLLPLELPPQKQFFTNNYPKSYNIATGELNEVKQTFTQSVAKNYKQHNKPLQITKSDANIAENSYTMSKNDWGYKISPFTNGAGKIVTSVTIKLRQLEKNEDNKKAITDRVKNYACERSKKGHFSYPSCGSAFKNNRAYGAPSGEIIDKCGLKGLRIGGAQVAPFHGNIIINTGRATSSDIYNLMKIVRNTVKEKTGYTLESEILFCPDNFLV